MTIKQIHRLIQHIGVLSQWAELRDSEISQQRELGDKINTLAIEFDKLLG